MEQEITYHTCSKCGEEKPLTEEYFTKRKDTNFGWRRECKKCRNKRDTIKRNKPENKKKHLKRSRDYYWNNKEKSLKATKRWSEKNKERISKKSAENYQKNKKQINQRRKERLKENPFLKVCLSYRSRLNAYFKGENKSKSTKELVGCSWEELKIYIENQFIDGMSWDNHGQFGWHLDHIIPLSSAKNEEELIKLSHYTNLQPLWWDENLKKSNKVL